LVALSTEAAETVGYHLYKAFPKLGVGSRADLAAYAESGD